MVSNISKNISADYLTNYVSNETKISAENIRITLMRPTGISDENMKFLQYRVSAPASSYNALLNPDIWPRNVKIREYVWRPKNNTVSLDDFLLRTTPPPATDQPESVQPESAQPESVQPGTIQPSNDM